MGIAVLAFFAKNKGLKNIFNNGGKKYLPLRKNNVKLANRFFLQISSEEIDEKKMGLIISVNHAQNVCKNNIANDGKKNGTSSKANRNFPCILPLKKPAVSAMKQNL